MEYFHGTNKTTATALQSGKVDVSKGGGELGLGFYTGELLLVAKSWATNRHRKDGAVVACDVPEADYFKLEPLLLSRTDALDHRNTIKVISATRSHTIGVNVVWSPIVGTTRVDTDQLKFEGKDAEHLLKSKAVARRLT